ncbi:hypothetical protein ACFPN1_09785 [Lysobacter yangpyeongensis]|uniref:Secreted protein n=1 Tax=Lysobacter yangpyeongensis TaxID=346182 RepID=A0ABW0SN83_9GAMM
MSTAFAVAVAAVAAVAAVTVADAAVAVVFAVAFAFARHSCESRNPVPLPHGVFKDEATRRLHSGQWP